MLLYSNVTMCIYVYVIGYIEKDQILLHAFVCFLYAVPDYPILNGTSCYSLTQDRSEEKVNVTIRLSLHSGWKSLAPVASIKGMLTLRGPVTLPSLPGFPPIVINGSLKHHQETQAIEASSCCKTHYTSHHLFS